MKNSKVYSQDSFDFYERVVSSKRNKKKDKAYLSRFKDYEAMIKELYEIYDEHFRHKELHKIGISGITEDQAKSDLLSLYNYDGKIFQELKKNLTTVEGRVFNTCQNCTINEVFSLDHIIPKDEFPEYSVNPKNLFPCCTSCNAYKSSNWKNGEVLLFLNLYLDNLPEYQYLFVELSFEDNTISTRFYLENRHGIPTKIYNLIESHYERLRLFNRFSLNNYIVISRLKNDVKSQIDRLDINIIREIVTERNEKNKSDFGSNYWQSILEETLIMDDQFFEWIRTN